MSSSAASQVLPPGISFEQDPSKPFEGTIAGLQVGQQITLYFSLFHVSQGATSFGPYALKILYMPPAPPGGGGGGGL